MKKIDYIICILFSMIALFSRFPLIEKFQSHWDGPQFSIAILHYSFAQMTPSPPGYPLYVALGKFFHLFIADPHQAILAVSILGSVLGCIIFYLVGKNIYNRTVGVIASIIFLTGSTFYYFSLTPYGYELVPPTTALLFYMVYRIYILRKNNGFLFGLLYGISFGLRPQETLFIGPLILLGFYFMPKKEKLFASLVFILITLFWLIPLIITTGGVHQYIAINFSAAKTDLGHISTIQNLQLVVKGFLLSFGIASVFLLYYPIKYLQTKKIPNKQILILYSLLIIPELLFNIFVMTVHAGYQMSYLTGLLLVVAFAIWKTTRKSKALMICIIISIAVFNLYWFFYDRDPAFTKPFRPTSFHYSDIRKNDIKVGSKVAFVEKHFSPKNTLIISADVLWRPYSYYLKEYAFSDLSGLDIKTPGFAYVRRDIKNWNLHEYQNKNLRVVIPANITHVVFMDDEAKLWMKNYPFTTYHLPANSWITALSVTPGDILRYGYLFVTVEKEIAQ